MSETSQRRKKHVEAENCPAIIASVHYVSKESRCRLLFEERYVCVCVCGHRVEMCSMEEPNQVDDCKNERDKTC